VLLNYNADEREAYRAALTSAGFLVMTIADPVDAIVVSRSRHPAAIVTRILQPGSAMDGIELTRRIKRDARIASMPVIVTSSLLEAHRGQEAMDGSHARCA
jgi:CheY-like chemotaxis protein